MGTVAEHYAQVLSDVYAWMYGGFEAALERNRLFFDERGIRRPSGSGRVADLGCGCGFQSIPLAERGFAVTAIDLDRKLLDELEEHRGALEIKTVQDDLLNFDTHAPGPLELATCMMDTILHLTSRAAVAELLAKVAEHLEPGGRFIVTFRDFSKELRELDRFIPVRSDDDVIFTCFLEYEPETVKVHDLVYRRADRGWTLHKSYYRKLRLGKEWLEAALSKTGLSALDSAVQNGFITIIATK